MKKGKKEFSVAIWSAIALGAIGAGVVVAFVAGFFLGHFTGHDKTTTVGTISSPTEPGTGSTASPGEGGGEAAEETAEARPEGEGGKVAVEADPSGELKFTKDQLSAKAGEVEIDFANESPVPHNVAIEAGGKVLGETKVISQGSDSTTVDLKPGTYTYVCTVPGHREAGMEGTLTVK